MHMPMTSQRHAAGALRGRTSPRHGLHARAVSYALFSELTRSPFSSDGSVLALPPADLPAVLADLGRELPFDCDTGDLASAAERLDERDAARMAAEYSSLFEVGQPGPPVAVRESLAVRDGRHAREEIVRYYEFFGYRLNPDQQWCPDHLSIELEFMHLLALRQAVGDSGDDQHLRASRDFLSRHLLAWFPPTVAAVRERAPASWWLTAWSCVGRFLERDRHWLDANLAGD